MEDKNSNPENTGKKKFSLINFLFGWMKSSPKEEPIKNQNEDGSPRDPAEIEAEEKAREESRKNAPKKSKAGMFVFFGIILLVIAAIAIWQYTSKEEPKEEPKKEQPTTPTQPGQPGPGGTQPTQPGPGGTQPTQPGPGGTQPTQPGQPGPGTPGTVVTFDFDQSFDWSTIAKSTQDMLKKVETSYPIYINDHNIILKTEVKNYNGKSMIWLQVERVKGQVKNIFTTADKINIIY